MQLKALPLWPGVSLTLIEDVGGWRFNSWSHFMQPLPLPAADDRERYFASAADAAEYFRTICPRTFS